MTKRDRMAGWMHLVEWLIVTAGLLGWVYFVTHPQRQYHLSKRDAEIRRKVRL